MAAVVNLYADNPPPIVNHSHSGPQRSMNDYSCSIGIFENPFFYKSALKFCMKSSRSRLLEAFSTSPWPRFVGHYCLEGVLQHE